MRKLGFLGLTAAALVALAGPASAAGDAEAVTLTSADGTRVGAYSARAEHTGGPGIVVLPDVRGLHPYFEELALRFAEAGVHAVARRAPFTSSRHPAP